MANNFHMFTHKTTETLHVKLTGDFDGSSASELINALSDNQNRYYQIFINTTELNDIYWKESWEVIEHIQKLIFEIAFI